ncbi:MAG: hypothetical protein EP330_15270 [Deltaproteobacteria bacterium]|nr:MAG: hypothetical protein EP330_15270 [Deltaproteobacteria bacterium]
MTVGVGAAAAWLAVPRPPALDGERLFKLSLATLFLGEVEAAGGDAEAWEAACGRWVPYHPAGREPEDKVQRPGTYKPPGEAQPGELALLEQLAKRTDVASRLAYLYREAEAGLEARMADPAELGADWDLSRWLGPELTWEKLAAWRAEDTRAGDALRRQLDVHWLCTPGPLADALASAVGAAAVDASAVLSWIEAHAPDRDQRVVLVGCGEDGLAQLELLRTEPGLRDRVLAVVAVGVPIWGREDGEGTLSPGARRDWMDANFRHEVLDTEANRLTPYCAMQWLDLDAGEVGAHGVSLGQARFGPPRGHQDALRIESVDLGPVVVGIDHGVLARALVATVAVLVLSKR